MKRGEEEDRWGAERLEKSRICGEEDRGVGKYERRMKKIEKVGEENGYKGEEQCIEDTE